MIEGVIFNALRGLVPNDRVFPGKFEQPDGSLPPWPSIMYALTDSDPVTSICGTGGGDTDDSQFEFELAAKTHGAMLALRDQVFAAFMNVDPPAVRRVYFWFHDTATKTFRAVIVYSFHPSSPSP